MKTMLEARMAPDRPGAVPPAVPGRLEARLAAGSFASFVSLLVGIGTAIVQVPLLVDAWGAETYGAWLLVTATYSLIIALDIGHQNYVANKISMLGLHDVVACKRVLGSAVKAGCIIGLAEVALAVAAVASGLFSVLLPEAGLAQLSVRAQASTSLVVQTVYFATAGSVGGILVRLYVAGGMYARSQWFGIAQRLAMFVALVGAAAAGASMAIATFAYVFAGSLVCVFTFVDLRYKFPAYWPWWAAGSLKTGLRQALHSLGLTASAVSDQCATAGLLGISGSRVHATGVASLGTLRTLANSILQAAGVLVLPVLPDLSRYAASADHAKATATLSMLWVISTAPMCLGVTIFGPLAGTLFNWWTRGTLAFSAILFALLAVAALVRQWQSPMAFFLFGANRMRSQVVISFLRTGTLLISLAIGFYFSADIAVAGVSILLSELVLAAATAAFTSRFLLEMHGQFPVGAAVLAALQVGVSVCGGFFLVGPQEPREDVIAACVVAHIALLVLQWRNLPIEVKQRVTNIVGPRFHFNRWSG